MSATALMCRLFCGYTAIRKPPAALVDAYTTIESRCPTVKSRISIYFYHQIDQGKNHEVFYS
jgi:hypothetical protein